MILYLEVTLFKSRICLDFLQLKSMGVMYKTQIRRWREEGRPATDLKTQRMDRMV